MLLDAQQNTYIIDKAVKIADNKYIPQTFIFQTEDDLKLLFKYLAKEIIINTKVEHIKQLNSYGRFVKIKETPDWLLHTLSDAIRKSTQELAMEINEM